jgi:hypothetical protein
VRADSAAALADGFVPLESDRPGSGYIVRELSLFPSRFAQETRIHRWDQEFESAFLQRRVHCELAPRGFDGAVSNEHKSASFPAGALKVAERPKRKWLTLHLMMPYLPFRFRALRAA